MISATPITVADFLAGALAPSGENSVARMSLESNFSRTAATNPGETFAQILGQWDSSPASALAVSLPVQRTQSRIVTAETNFENFQFSGAIPADVSSVSSWAADSEAIPFVGDPSRVSAGGGAATSNGESDHDAGPEEIESLAPEFATHLQIRQAIGTPPGLGLVLTDRESRAPVFIDRNTPRTISGQSLPALKLTSRPISTAAENVHLPGSFAVSPLLPAGTETPARLLANESHPNLRGADRSPLAASLEPQATIGTKSSKTRFEIEPQPAQPSGNPTPELGLLRRDSSSGPILPGGAAEQVPNEQRPGPTKSDPSQPDFQPETGQSTAARTSPRFTLPSPADEIATLSAIEKPVTAKTARTFAPDKPNAVPELSSPGTPTGNARGDGRNSLFEGNERESSPEGLGGTQVRSTYSDSPAPSRSKAEAISGARFNLATPSDRASRFVHAARRSGKFEASSGRTESTAKGANEIPSAANHPAAKVANDRTESLANALRDRVPDLTALETTVIREMPSGGNSSGAARMASRTSRPATVETLSGQDPNFPAVDSLLFPVDPSRTGSNGLSIEISSARGESLEKIRSELTRPAAVKSPAGFMGSLETIESHSDWETKSLSATPKEVSAPEFAAQLDLFDLAGQITASAKPDGGWVVLEIQPPELGKLEIQVSRDGDALTARIVAHESSTADLLTLQRGELLEALGQQGWELRDLQITSDSTPSATPDGHRQAARDFQDQAGSSGHRSPRQQDAWPEHARNPLWHQPATPDSLNILV